jgi:hypothetical protein
LIISISNPALMLVIRAWSLYLSGFVSFHGRNDLLARH